MDAFAVSISCGMFPLKDALKAPIYFGMFQAFMPLIGWSAGVILRDFISCIDHWIAFGLLILIGCKMIYEAINHKPTERNFNSLNIHVLLMLSVATSIDALAVGISFAFLKTSILVPAILIGVITFILSLIGIFIGNRLGHFFENKIKVVGGLVLVSIGVKILLEHLT